MIARSREKIDCVKAHEVLRADQCLAEVKFHTELPKAGIKCQVQFSADALAAPLQRAHSARQVNSPRAGPAE